MVTDDLITSNDLKAGEIVKQVAAFAEGSGGGRPHMALAGGKNISKIGLALEKAPEIILNLAKK